MWRITDPGVFHHLIMKEKFRNVLFLDCPKIFSGISFSGHELLTISAKLPIFDVRMGSECTSVWEPFLFRFPHYSGKFSYALLILWKMSNIGEMESSKCYMALQLNALTRRYQPGQDVKNLFSKLHHWIVGIYLTLKKVAA